MARKKKTPEALVAKLCHSLGELRAFEIKASMAKDANGAAKAVEALIHERLTDEMLADPALRATLVSTGAPALIKQVQHSQGTQVRLSATHWRRLLSCTRPNEVRDIVGAGVSHSGLSVQLLGRIASGHIEWRPLLEDIARRKHVRDHAILTKPYRGLLTTPSNAGVTAIYLRAQVENHGRMYTELAKNFICKAQIYEVALLTAAGVPLDDILKGLYRPGPVAERFVEATSSAHGKLAYFERCRSLEHLLANPDPFEEWRQQLARDAGVVLPVS